MSTSAEKRSPGTWELKWATFTRFGLAALRARYLPRAARRSRPTWLLLPLLGLYAGVFAGWLMHQDGGRQAAWLTQQLRRVLPLAMQSTVIAWPIDVVAGGLGAGLAIGATGALLLYYQVQPPTQDEVMQTILDIRRRAADEAAGRLSETEIMARAAIRQGVALGWLGARQRPTRIGLDYATGKGHCITIGPTLSGKGLAATDTLLCWPGSAVVIDPKGELYERTAGTRAGWGQRIYRIPGDTLDLSQYFNLAQHDDAADLHANLLRPWMDRDRVFADKNLSLFLAVGVYAHKRGLNPVRTLLELAGAPLGTVLTRLDSVVPNEIRAYTDGMDSRAALDNRFMTSAWGTFTTRAFQFRGHIDTVASLSPTIPLDWEQQGGTLYITYDFTDLVQMGPLMSAVVAALVRHHLRQPARRTLFLMDEAKSVALAKLSEYLATVASSGISFSLYLQTLTQLEEVYGRDASRTILSNCRYQAWYAPGDETTAEHMSKVYGDTYDFSYSSGDANQAIFETANTARGPVVASERTRPVLSPTEFSALDGEQVLVIVSKGGRQLRTIAQRPNILPLLKTLPPPPLAVPTLSLDELLGLRASVTSPRPAESTIPPDAPPPPDLEALAHYAAQFEDGDPAVSLDPPDRRDPADRHEPTVDPSGGTGQDGVAQERVPERRPRRVRR